MKFIRVLLMVCLLLFNVDGFAFDTPPVPLRSAGFTVDFPYISSRDLKVGNKTSLYYLSSEESVEEGLSNVIKNRNEYYTINNAIIPYQLDDGEELYVSVGNQYQFSYAIENQIIDYICNIYYTLLLENPKFCYVATTFMYSYNVLKVDENNSTLYCNISVYPEYIDTITPELQSLADEKADYIIASTIKDGMSDAEKALVLHDYIVDNTVYNSGVNTTNTMTDYDRMSFTAYGPIINGLAVCQGYSLAYNYLLNKCGIETKFVSSSELNHGWSLVKIDDNWYHVDTTWDDPTNFESVLHRNFLVSDSGIISTGHTSWDNITVTCSDDKYSALNYCFSGTNNQFSLAIKYDNGKFYSRRMLLLNSDYSLNHVYGYNKTYYNYYLIDNNKYALDYVSCEFNGDNFNIISQEEYENAGNDGYSYTIYPLYNNSFDISQPVTVSNIKDTVLFLKNNSDTTEKIVVFTVFYDSDNKVVNVEKQAITERHDYSIADASSCSYNADKVLIFGWVDGKLKPLSKTVSIY